MHPPAPGYPGLDGFLPFGRGSLMLDVVFLAMFVVVPLLAVSIWLVKSAAAPAAQAAAADDGRGAAGGGGCCSRSTSAFNGWELRAAPSPYFDPASKWTCPAGISLIVHLCFAVPTLAAVDCRRRPGPAEIQPPAAARPAQPLARPHWLGWPRPACC